MKEFALHILDIAENGIRAGADSIVITLDLDPETSLLQMEISDNGSGIDEELLKKVTDPFFTSREVRKVGLGIPLLRQHAEMTGGKVELYSRKGEGTSIIAWFNVSHPDMQPPGDIEGCWYLLASGNTNIDIVLKCTTGKDSYQISTREVIEALGQDGFRGIESRKQLLSLIRNNLQDMGFYWN